MNDYDKTDGRLPERGDDFDFRPLRYFAYRLDDSHGEKIYITPTPDTIIAHFHPLDTRVHVAEEMDDETPDDEYQTWEYFSTHYGIRPRLFEEPDGTRVITFHTEDSHGRSPGIAYEWNIDSDDPTRSGWKPIRYTEPVDQLREPLGKLQQAMETVNDVINAMDRYEPKAIAAAVDSTEWDTAARIPELVEWLKDLQYQISARFTAEAIAEDPDLEWQMEEYFKRQNQDENQ